MVYARKSLGQHFLTSPSAISEIVRAGEIKNGEKVLEIGPGKGVLTEALLSAGAEVTAVEKDRTLFEFLKEKLSKETKSGQLNLVCDDILNLDLKNYKLKTENYKLIANIPYNITGEILRKFIGGEIKPSRAVLLVQKEVAERIIARDKKESVLSLSVKAYGTPKILKKVPAGAFNPPPKVDSSILLIENIENNFRDKAEEKRFFEILKAGFAHKRKKLTGNLAPIFGKEKAAEILNNYGVSKDARAEDLSLEEWIGLSKN